jgi:hypothetical protein
MLKATSGQKESDKTKQKTTKARPAYEVAE